MQDLLKNQQKQVVLSKRIGEVNYRDKQVCVVAQSFDN